MTFTVTVASNGRLHCTLAFKRGSQIVLGLIECADWPTLLYGDMAGQLAVLADRWHVGPMERVTLLPSDDVTIH